MPEAASRASQLDRTLTALLAQAPEVEAAAVVSFDGLPMASALPATMDEDRVAAMSAALLSLGERAAEGLGRGALSQVYIEGESGTVFLVSADDEAVLVAVAAKGAKVGMMLYEVRRAAAQVAEVLRAEDAEQAAADAAAEAAAAAAVEAAVAAATAAAQAAPVAAAPTQPTPADVAPVEPVAAEPVAAEAVSGYAPVGDTWPNYQPNGSVQPVSPPAWS